MIDHIHAAIGPEHDRTDASPAHVLTTYGKDQAKVTTSAAEYKTMWAPRTLA
jgi:hypothetical protein